MTRNTPVRTSSRRRKFDNPDVKRVFRTYPKRLRDKLLTLRQLIFETAAATPGVGPLEETLKWGQPSYLTSQSRSGSTIRIDATGEDGGYALYVHCQTNLIAKFRSLYPREFTYEGKRAIVFDGDEVIPLDALRHCVAMALTYHLNKKKG